MTESLLDCLPTFVYYRRGAGARWRFGRWPMSSGTAFDLGCVRVMTRRARRNAVHLRDWFGV